MFVGDGVITRQMARATDFVVGELYHEVPAPRLRTSLIPSSNVYKMALPLIFAFDVGEAIRKPPTTHSLAVAYSTAAITLVATSSLNVVVAYSTFAAAAGYLVLRARLNALHYQKPKDPSLNSATNKITTLFCCHCCLAYGGP